MHSSLAQMLQVPLGARRRCPGSPCERLWLGVALLSIAFDAAATDSRPLPSGFETLIEREPPALAAPDDAPRAPLAVIPAAPDATSQQPANPAGLGPTGAGLGASGAGLGASGAAPLGSRSLAPFEPASPLSLESLRLDEFAAGDLAPRDFRPRRPSLNDQRLPKAEDSLMSDSDTWQHLANDYRIQHRLRVLTLWDAGWSSLSLQAGRHGDPSLQWTGHLLGRSEAHRGVLDRWMPRFSPPAVEGRGIAHALGGLPKMPGGALPHAGAALP